MFFADPVAEPVYYGRSVADALEWVRGFAFVPAPADLTDLREMLSAHLRPDGVWFDSRAWLVTASRWTPPVAG